MALIRCAECKTKVSDKAAACPKCGAPVELSKKKQKRQISTGCGCLLVLLIVGVIIAAFVASDKDSRPRSPSTPASRSAVPAPKKTAVPMPKYEVVDRDIYDAPIKTQIVMHAVVSGTVTETVLRQLLQKLYTEAQATRGFKHHGGKPTHVAIYLYTSLQHFKSGMGQWIGMLSKIGKNAKVDISVKSELISQLDAKPEKRFDLSEEKRKQIFREIVLAEDKASKNSQEKFPDDPTQSLSIGQSFQLTEQTPLMPEVEPKDPMAALKKMKYLPPKTTIKVREVAKKGISSWYRVKARTSDGMITEGWINSTALMGQAKIDFREQLKKQGELGEKLQDKYKNEIAKKCGLTRDQLWEISLEAMKKNWPMP